MEQNTEDFVKRALGIASYYGFDPLMNQKTTERRNALRLVDKKEIKGLDPLCTALFRALSECAGQANHAVPRLGYHLQNGSAQASDGRRSKHKTIRLGLSVVGINRSIAEALLLRTALAILEESGTKNVCVHINSLGDRDSAQKFVHEVLSYLRKHVADLPSDLRPQLRDNLSLVIGELYEKNHPLSENMPKPMTYLSEGSRRHLRELLEYLETNNISYEIDEHLIGSCDTYSEALFEIRQETSGASSETSCEHSLARGGRCDELSRKLFRMSIPNSGIIIERPCANPVVPATAPSVRRAPKVHFVQIGLSAKMHALSIVEDLRRARIPLSQLIHADGLREQLAFAEALGIPYAIIVGQRELIDNTAIVRNLSTQSQETVSIPLLPAYLKEALRG